MIDIKLLQKDFDYVVTALQKKGVDNELLNNLKILASNTKQKRQEMEDVTALQNVLSKKTFLHSICYPRTQHSLQLVVMVFHMPQLQFPQFQTPG